MKKIIMAIALILAVGTLSSQAATKIYWNGSVDNLFTNGSNWVGGTVPTDNDYSDQAVFQDSSLSGVMSKDIKLNSRKINAILLYDTGYYIFGGEFKTKYFTSTGVGTNTIDRLKALTGANWNIGTGNTLVVSTGLYQDGSNNKLIFKGGGTFYLDTYINGYGGTNYQELHDITLIINSSKVYVNNYVTKLTMESSDLQLKTTVTAAEALITTSKITESIGNGLEVTDIGDGFVSIKIAPPPPPVILGTVLIVK
ncbi:MAG: hypothetical protein PF692_08235 [Kiritimatiellae bacterium]|jgi:hypothetical protein|nr:hypothetical protein [Kiritimatiellia bacterium]